jgi:hypothetical protein
MHNTLPAAATDGVATSRPEGSVPAQWLKLEASRTEKHDHHFTVTARENKHELYRLEEAAYR